MRTALSTPGMASSDSRHAVTSPMPDRADHDALLADDGVDLVAEIADPLADVVDLFFRRVQPHRNNHGWCSLPKQKTHSFEWVGFFGPASFLKPTPLYAV